MAPGNRTVGSTPESTEQVFSAARDAFKAGDYARAVAEKGRTQTLSGQSSYKDNTLALLQDEGPPLVGKVTLQENSFLFAPPGTNDKAPGLTFNR